MKSDKQTFSEYRNELRKIAGTGWDDLSGGKKSAEEIAPPITRPATAETITDIRVNREYSVLLSMLNDELGQLEHRFHHCVDEKLDATYELYAVFILKGVIRKFKLAYGDNDPC